jgi:hypothetical protein
LPRLAGYARDLKDAVQRDRRPNGNSLRPDAELLGNLGDGAAAAAQTHPRSTRLSHQVGHSQCSLEFSSGYFRQGKADKASRQGSLWTDGQG